MTDPDYQARISFEIARYACSDIRDVPPIYDYWMDTYIRPKLNCILRVDTIRQFYVEHIFQRASDRKPSEKRIVSLGSADAELEIQIATDLLSRGLDAFSIDCLELSPPLIDRANRQITAAGLVPYINVIQSDLNSPLTTWSEVSSVAVVANHILHHVVDLEGLFANVQRTIGDSGVFLTADMIGRNGHKRWPESLSLITTLWETLPDSLRYNHISAKVDQTFDDYDCLAAGGFEGIRAQDILPLLIEHFQFEKFLAFGCLPEALFGGAYGPNFDPELLAHRQFVGSIDSLNTSLLELGVLKPTMVFAVMSNKATRNTRIWKMLSPQFCVRNPAEDVSFAPQRSPLLSNAHDAVSLGFQEQALGSAALLSGWGSPEDWAPGW
jgi:hypothetical protein